MGAINLGLHCPQNVNGITADPQPDWSFDNLLSELDTIEKKLITNLNISVPFDKKQARNLRASNENYCSTGGFVMHVSDHELGFSDSDIEEEVFNTYMFSGRRFGLDEIYMSDDSDYELPVHAQCHLMDKVGLAEGALHELNHEFQLYVLVFEFLEKISSSLTDLASKELSLLKELKRKEEGELSFGIEDLQYYVKRVKEQQFDLDFEVIKQYFPVGLVLSGIFKICPDLFGLRFEEVADADVWHQDVQLFSVFDLSSGEPLGYFYLDLYAREGKYGHTCVVSLQNGSNINSARQIPVAVLISQLRKEVNGHSTLLRFSEVVNLFHEFGHVVHHICNRATFARFSGLLVDPDLVEIPSLVLEHWCYENSFLKMVSGLHQDITKPIEDDVCRLLEIWRFSFSAIKLKQEIVYCLFDQIIHSVENVDMLGLLNHLHSKVMFGLPMLEGTNPASCFPRTVIGYEATCYSRIWSEVFAADIFATKFRDDIFNQNAGMQFRKKVLCAGGARDPWEMLTDFLGREPSLQAS